MALTAEVQNHRTHQEPVQAALPQYKPSYPPLTFVLVGALVGGLAVGGGLVFLVNAMDRSLQTTGDAVGFGMPVLGVIDEIVAERERVKRKRRRWTLGPVISAVIVIALGFTSLSLVLWLKYPDQFAKLWADPVSLVLRPALTMQQPPRPEEVKEAPAAPAAPAAQPPAPAAETPAASKPANGASPDPLALPSTTNEKP
jgi:hypothetical protein